MAKNKTKDSVQQICPRSILSSLWSLIVWLVGILVALAVGFGMIGENGVPILKIAYLPGIFTITAGWFVVILTVLGVVLKVIDKLSGK